MMKKTGYNTPEAELILLVGDIDCLSSSGELNDDNIPSIGFPKN